MKAMMARDSEKLCVLDGSEKNKDWLKFVLAPICFFILFALTFYGMVLTIEQKDAIEAWFTIERQVYFLIGGCFGLLVVLTIKFVKRLRG